MNEHAHTERHGLKIALLIVVAAAVFVTIARCAPAAGLLIADGGLGGTLEIQQHDVQVTINNGVAVTEVEQVFVNTENRQVEALYTFPVPKGASVANFSMWINGKEMIGEVLEKKRAREIYNSYKRVRRDPGLLEQVDYKTFEMRIFPIGPRAEQRVRIAYYQQLDFDNDWATYVYPLATVTRRDIDQRTTGRFSITFDARSAVPIAEMQSPSHADAFVIAPHSDDYYQASLETTAGDLGRDVVLAFKTVRPHTGIDVITSRHDREDGYFLLTFTAGEELATLNEPMDYVFVVDISGSMARDDKLRTSARSVGAFVESLGEDDRFEVMVFNVKPDTLFNELRLGNDDAKAEVRRFLDTQQARGGTVLRSAMATAYKYKQPDRALNVVILSDGMTEQGERQGLLQLIAQRPDDCRVFCIGVGNEVNGQLLEELANDAGGLAAFISHGDDFDRQARAFRRKLTRPVATDLKIAFDGVEVSQLEPQTLPNLYHGSPVRLYGRYEKGGPATVNINASVNGQAISRQMQIELPTRDDSSPQIERMWAWHRVQRLLNDADRVGSRDSVLEEIITLGEGYSIASEYTSFIVLENDAEYKRWKIKRRNATRIERDRTARRQVAAELEALRTKAEAGLGPIAPLAKGPDPVVDLQTGPSARRTTPTNRNSRSQDISLPGGGGAIDPLSGTIVIGMGLAGLIAARHRRLTGPNRHRRRA